MRGLISNAFVIVTVCVNLIVHIRALLRRSVVEYFVALTEICTIDLKAVCLHYVVHYVVCS